MEKQNNNKKINVQNENIETLNKIELNCSEETIFSYNDLPSTSTKKNFTNPTKNILTGQADAMVKYYSDQQKIIKDENLSIEQIKELLETSWNISPDNKKKIETFNDTIENDEVQELHSPGKKISVLLENCWRLILSNNNKDSKQEVEEIDMIIDKEGEIIHSKSASLIEDITSMITEQSEIELKIIETLEQITKSISENEEIEDKEDSSGEESKGFPITEEIERKEDISIQGTIGTPLREDVGSKGYIEDGGGVSVFEETAVSKVQNEEWDAEELFNFFLGTVKNYLKSLEESPEIRKVETDVIPKEIPELRMKDYDVTVKESPELRMKDYDLTVKENPELSTKDYDVTVKESPELRMKDYDVTVKESPELSMKDYGVTVKESPDLSMKDYDVTVKESPDLTMKDYDVIVKESPELSLVDETSVPDNDSMKAESKAQTAIQDVQLIKELKENITSQDTGVIPQVGKTGLLTKEQNEEWDAEELFNFFLGTVKNYLKSLEESPEISKAENDFAAKEKSLLNMKDYDLTLKGSSYLSNQDYDVTAKESRELRKQDYDITAKESSELSKEVYDITAEESPQLRKQDYDITSKKSTELSMYVDKTPTPDNKFVLIKETENKVETAIQDDLQLIEERKDNIQDGLQLVEERKVNIQDGLQLIEERKVNIQDGLQLIEERKDNLQDITVQDAGVVPQIVETEELTKDQTEEWDAEELFNFFLGTVKNYLKSLEESPEISKVDYHLTTKEFSESSPRSKTEAKTGKNGEKPFRKPVVAPKSQGKDKKKLKEIPISGKELATSDKDVIPSLKEEFEKTKSEKDIIFGTKEKASSSKENRAVGTKGKLEKGKENTEEGRIEEYREDISFRTRRIIFHLLGFLLIHGLWLYMSVVCPRKW